MRRHCQQSGDYIEWLKSLGCVLYLPLSQSGDTQDRISGNSLVYTGTGNQPTWDSNKNMYLFQGYTQNTISHTLNTGWTSNTFANNEFTVMTTFMKNSASGNGALLSVGNCTTPMGGALMQKGTSVCSNWVSGEYKCAYALSSSGRWLYDNGALYSSYSAYTPYLPASWGGYTWFVGNYNSQNINASVFIKEVLMFNTILDLSTIRKIQGYE